MNIVLSRKNLIRVAAMLFLLATWAQANPGEFSYATYKGAVTITKYQGADADVTIPATIDGLPVTSIGKDAFNGWLQHACTSLTNVVIPESVTSIGDNAFYYCVNLPAIKIGRNVTRIGYLPFRRCNKMTAITVDPLNPEYSSVDGVLFDKKQTTLLHYPGGKTEPFVIPGTTTLVKEWSLAECFGLSRITVPASVTTIEQYAFCFCTNLTDIVVDPLNSRYSSVEGVLFDKSRVTLIQYPANRRGAYTIPDGVTNIWWGAFRFCPWLTAVTIPGSVTSIGDLAFNNCDSLTSVTIPDSVISIGGNAFQNCLGLTNVMFGTGLKSIGSMGFNECVKLEGAWFNGTPPVVGFYGFSGSKNLTIYYQPEIVGWAPRFGGRPTAPWQDVPGFVYGLDKTVSIIRYTGTGGEVAIPAAIHGYPVTSIGTGAFYTCSGLTSITLPPGMASIGFEAFAFCAGFTNITLPASVTNIAKDAFVGCPDLVGFDVEATNPIYSSKDGVLFDKAQSRLICYPEAKVGAYTIPDSVTNIGSSAFYGCVNLPSVTVGTGVTSIDDMAFSACTGLTGVVFRGNAPILGDSVFERDLKATVYYLPGTTGWGTTFGCRPTVMTVVPER